MGNILSSGRNSQKFLNGHEFKALDSNLCCHKYLLLPTALLVWHKRGIWGLPPSHAILKYSSNTCQLLDRKLQRCTEIMSNQYLSSCHLSSVSSKGTTIISVKAVCREFLLSAKIARILLSASISRIRSAVDIANTHTVVS